jgi:hypothetical protein
VCRRGRGRVVPDRAHLRPGQRERGHQHGPAPELVGRPDDAPGQSEPAVYIDVDAYPVRAASGRAAESQRQPEAKQVRYTDKVPQELTADQPVRLGEHLTNLDGFINPDEPRTNVVVADVIETLEKTQGGLAQCEI